MPENGGTDASAYSEMPTSSSVEARMPKLVMMLPNSPVSPSKLNGAVDEATGAAVEVEVAAAAVAGAGAASEAEAEAASLSSLTRLAGGSEEGSIRCSRVRESHE